MMNAMELYAAANSTKCEGDEACHWCAGPCKRLWLHDDPPPIPFTRSKSSAMRPSNAYVCVGCWLFRRKRITVTFLDGSYKDGQAPVNHSWLFNGEAKTLKQNDPNIYDFLVQPPRTFVLALREEGQENHVHRCPVNANPEVKGETELKFMLNNVLHVYTVYELEQALQRNDKGKEPGVRALLKFFGPPKSGTFQKTKAEKGRYSNMQMDDPRKVVVKSGLVTA